jgi:hypothetical protein
MSRQTALVSAASRIDAEISRVQYEIKALDRSILAQQQQRSTLSANLDSLLAAKEKSDMLPPTCLAFLSFALSPHAHASAQFISNLLAIYFPVNLVCRDAVSSRISSERQWADAQGFPWSQILHSMLSECFRLHTFRPGQLEAINCVSHQTRFFYEVSI